MLHLFGDKHQIKFSSLWEVSLTTKIVVRSWKPSISFQFQIFIKIKDHKNLIIYIINVHLLSACSQIHSNWWSHIRQCRDEYAIYFLSFSWMLENPKKIYVSFFVSDLKSSYHHLQILIEILINDNFIIFNINYSFISSPLALSFK